MAIVDNTGVQPTSTPEYIELLGQAFRVVYPDIDLSVQTPQAQIVALLAHAFAQRDLELVAVASGFDIYTATGLQLDRIVALTGLTREDGETDDALRNRYFSVIGRGGTGVRESICAHVRELAGVDDCAVVENSGGASAVVEGLTLAAHSIGVIVEGAAEAADVAAVIGLHKPLGIATNGGTSEDVENADGTSTTIRYYPASAIAVDIDLTIDTDAAYPSDGSTRIASVLVDYFDGLELGESHVDERVRAAILHAVPGYSITTIAYSDTSGSALPATLRADQRLTLSTDDVSVVIT